jgi:hypothetical protein
MFHFDSHFVAHPKGVLHPLPKIIAGNSSGKPKALRGNLFVLGATSRSIRLVPNQLPHANSLYFFLLHPVWNTGFKKFSPSSPDNKAVH